MPLDWSALREAALLARRRRNWTQHDLAEHADTSVSTVRRFEAGTHSPDTSTLQKIVAALELQLARFETGGTSTVGTPTGGIPIVTVPHSTHTAKERLIHHIEALTDDEAAAVETAVKRALIEALHRATNPSPSDTEPDPS